MLMAWSCSGLTLTMDWRFEALFWYGAPLLLALLMDPSWKMALSLPSKQLHVQTAPSSAPMGEENLSFAEKRNIAAWQMS